jgi:hypothetical protein
MLKKSEFSEFVYQYNLLREIGNKGLFENFKTFIPTIDENTELKGCLFLQAKVPTYVIDRKKRGYNFIDPLPYLRFQLQQNLNSRYGTKQHNRLRLLANKFSNHVYYVMPNFHTRLEFNEHVNNQT